MGSIGKGYFGYFSVFCFFSFEWFFVSCVIFLSFERGLGCYGLESESFFWCWGWII